MKTTLGNTRIIAAIMIGLPIAALIVGYIISAFEEPAPTADQLYGCTIAQQAPNGECR